MYDLLHIYLVFQQLMEAMASWNIYCEYKELHELCSNTENNGYEVCFKFIFVCLFVFP